MANVTLDDLSTTLLADVTSAHYLLIDNATTTTRVSALSGLIQSISTLGAAGASVVKSHALGVLYQRDIIGGTGITVTENTNDLTLSVTQGDININNLAGISSFDLSGADNTSSLFLTSVNLASNVTGTLPIANGGTGQTSFTANSVLLGGASISTAVLDADKEILVGTTSGPEMKTLTAGSNISITQNNSLDTLTVAFTKGNYIESGDNATLGDTTVGALTVESITPVSRGSITQGTSMSTAVTVNAPSGVIQLYTGTIAADSNTQFTVNNTSVAANSAVLLSKESQSVNDEDNGIHVSLASVSNGSFVVNITHTGNSLAGSCVRKIHFLVIG
jgi:hypothetical protein